MKLADWAHLNSLICGTWCDCVGNCIASGGNLLARTAQRLGYVLPEDSFNHKLLSWSIPLLEIFISSHVLRYPFRNKEHTHVPQEIVRGTKMDYSCCAGGFSLWKTISATVFQIKIILASSMWMGKEGSDLISANITDFTLSLVRDLFELSQSALDSWSFTIPLPPAPEKEKKNI